MYEQKEMPSWFTHRSVGPSISFTIPSSPNKLKGLNFCCVHTSQFPEDPFLLDTCWVEDDHSPLTPMITITNVTKNRMWIYERYLRPCVVDRKCWILLSHWMFGRNEMEVGDHVTITVTMPYDELVKECGVRVVYDEEEEEDALGYYKSWNHIIGGDLYPFQTKTGEYILRYDRFFKHGIYLYHYHRKIIPDGPNIQGRCHLLYIKKLLCRMYNDLTA